MTEAEKTRARALLDRIVSIVGELRDKAAPATSDWRRFNAVAIAHAELRKIIEEAD